MSDPRGAYLIYLDSTGAATTLVFDAVMEETWTGTNTITDHPVETGADVTDHVRVGLMHCELSVFVTNEPFRSNTFANVAPQTISFTIAAPGQDPATGQTLTAKQWDNGLGIRTALQAAGVAVGGFAGDVAGGLVGAALAPARPKDVPFNPGVGLDPTPGQQFSAKLQTVTNPQDFVALYYATLETLRQSAQLITVSGSKNYQPNMVIESVEMNRSADTGTGADIKIGLREIRFVTTQTVNAPMPSIPSGATPVKKGQQNPVDIPPQKRTLALEWAQKIFGATVPLLKQP
jgi:hypothetical protein